MVELFHLVDCCCLPFSGTLNTLFQPVGTRGQYFLPFKLGGNLLCFHAIQGHTVDTLDHLGGLIVYVPVFRVIRVFHIAIGRLSHRLARIALDLILIRRFLEMSRAYHSLNRLRIGASSFSPSAVSMLSETATRRIPPLIHEGVYSSTICRIRSSAAVFICTGIRSWIDQRRCPLWLAMPLGDSAA